MDIVLSGDASWFPRDRFEIRENAVARKSTE